MLACTAALESPAMAKINVFNIEIDGRIDASEAVGSTATAMYIYERGDREGHAVLEQPRSGG
jgi:hypothetical protein